MKSPPDETFAAVDLGSNSFHMVVARFAEGRTQIIDRIKEMVSIASGLDADNNLSEEAMERGLQCLERFRQRIKEISRANVRVVGTNTLRQARNGAEFERRARQTLGRNIEIISGQEEARLIFAGVAQASYNDDETRLVIDIGGGSTELIIGKGEQPQETESLYMGCVNVSKRFFPDGGINAKRMRKAVLFARTELETVEVKYRRRGWDVALGSSGTIRAISDVATAKGWCEAGITAAAVKRLQRQLIRAGHHEKLTLAALSDLRKPVFAGGVAILSAIIEALKLEQVQISDGALREGIIYELIGRRQDKDIRKTTVANLAARYGADQEQADKVAKTAAGLCRQVKTRWQFNKADEDALLWAARLHEIGLAIAHAQHHRHGAYLLSNSDLPGFSKQEQDNLSLLVRAHRRKFPVLEFNQTPAEDQPRLLRLAILLRVACVANRSRSQTLPADIKATAAAEGLSLQFPQGWLDEHPLTREDLQTEAESLAAVNFQLEFD